MFAAAVTCLLPFLDPGLASAYRLWVHLEDGRVGFSEHAIRWSAAAWGPGETLVFEVAADPDFDVLFGSPEGVIPHFERALAAWSKIPTADLQMSVGGVAEEGRNPYLTKLYIDPDSYVGGYAGGWDRFISGEWERFSCNIGMGGGYAVIPDDVEPEDLDDFLERQREGFVNVLVHEVGHCLGLLHAGALSSVARWVWDSEWVQIHPRDPAMSYGYGQEEPEGLSADDIVGASLLRPASGWLATTGTISGTLGLDGEPAPYAHVWALPARGESLRDRVGGFSDHEGRFRIEGLKPGGYALWAGPLHEYGAHGGLMRDEPPLDLDETIRGRPVWVHAERTTADVHVSLRRGQVARPPPGRVVARQESGSPVSIIGRWGTPCAGVRIRAGKKPSLADGPRAEPDRQVGDERWYGTTLTLEWSPDSGAVVFDWAGPWRNWYWDRDEEGWKFFDVSGELGSRGPELDVNISHWRMRRSGSESAVHTAEIAWPESTEVLLRFRSADGDDSCDGEPLVICTIAGCGLTSAPSAAP